MIEIDVAAVPNQTFQASVDGQDCEITLRQMGARMYMDLVVDGTVGTTGHICLDQVPIPRHSAPLTGRFFFTDATGQQEAPQYSGLGTRWKLYWDADVGRAKRPY